MNTKKLSKAAIADRHLKFLEKLVVGIGEVSVITGISQRKLRYWQEKGIVSCVPESPSTTRRFDYLNIRKIIILDEFLREGYTLEMASLKADIRVKAEIPWLAGKELT